MADGLDRCAWCGGLIEVGTGRHLWGLRCNPVEVAEFYRQMYSEQRQRSAIMSKQPRFSSDTPLVTVRADDVRGIPALTTLAIVDADPSGDSFEYLVAWRGGEARIGQSVLAALCGMDPDADPRT